MAIISRLKTGQILFDKHKTRMGNTTMTRWGLWRVLVIEIDPELQWIIASWNGNKAEKMYAGRVKKFKVKEPEMPKDLW
jgi:hypothetical protein